MTKYLPDRPSFENLKKQAKSLLHAHQQGDPSVCDVLRHLHRFAQSSPDEILSAHVTLAEVQFSLAQEYGFTSWRALKQQVESMSPRRYLHVFCVEFPANILRESGVPGIVVVWQDPLIEGPVPSGVSEQQWLVLRAQQLDDIFATTEQAVQALQNMDRQLAQFPEYEEVILWFDACLYDQVVLCRQLDWFSRQSLGDTRLSMVTISEYPGLPVFHGLGELNADQLAGLLPTRHLVTSAEIALGISAWQAYRSADPTAIEHLLAQDTSALPYLAPALYRHLERFPSVRNGLSRMEQEILHLVSEEVQRFSDLFHRLSDIEQPAFFGTGYLFHQLETLASGQYPLLALHGLEAFQDRPRSEWPIEQNWCTLTTTGDAVLRQQADWVSLNGIDRWLGGVHLQGNQDEWRWDAQQRELVRRLA